MEGRFSDEDVYQRKLTQAVEEVVARQRDIGIDLVNDGEYGHSMGHRYDYGSWWTFQHDIANFEAALASQGLDTGFSQLGGPG
jgi:methionine synthase II (cobalamin-independent)